MGGKFAWAAGMLATIGLVAAAAIPPSRALVGSYRTPLQDRERNQRANALRAARALHGTVLEPGEVLSFNRTVGPWTADRGYLKAPVSYGGEMHPAWGGGVCQTSTTLYNAALVAGLEIVERHRHQWAPHYCPLGRDAAVAQYDIDLRLRNSHPWPVRIEAQPTEDSLGVAILGREAGPMATLHTKVRGVLPPREVLRIDSDLRPGECHRLVRGAPGYRVLVYRELRDAQGRELVSEDRYPPVNRLVVAGP
ncbi:MAG: VanW family protein [Armatimonadota bacterium]|nr:VanW family protein [Armatimonadota bacterium]